MALLSEFFQDIEGFQWDEANASKNWTRHQVSQTEAEQVFLNRPVVVIDARTALRRVGLRSAARTRIAS